MLNQNNGGFKIEKPWKEKTGMEKTVSVISWIALLGVMVLLALKLSDIIEDTEVFSNILIGIVCLCQAYLSWKERRTVSYICIVVACLLFVLAVLSFMLQIGA